MNQENIIDNNTTKPSPFNIAMKWALVSILVSVIMTMLSLYLNDNKYDPNAGGMAVKIGGIALMIGIMVMCLKEYRSNSLDGYMTFGQGFKAMWYYSLLATLFTVIFMAIFYNFIIDFDTYSADQMDVGIQAMKDRGMSSEQIKSDLEMVPGFVYTQWFSLVIFAFFSMMFNIIIGLILAAIFKRIRPANA